MRYDYVSKFLNSKWSGNLSIDYSCNTVVAINAIDLSIGRKKEFIVPNLIDGETDTSIYLSGVYYIFSSKWEECYTKKLSSVSIGENTLYKTSNKGIDYYMYNGFLFDSKCDLYLMPGYKFTYDSTSKLYNLVSNTLAVSSIIFNKLDTKIKGFVNKSIYCVMSKGMQYNVEIVPQSKMKVFVPYGTGYNCGLENIFKGCFYSKEEYEKMNDGYYYRNEIEHTFNPDTIRYVNDTIRLKQEELNPLLCEEKTDIDE